MELELKTNYGFSIVVKAENVNIEEDIESRTYPKDENGKMIYSKGCERDVSDEYLNKVSRLLDDMIYYRKSEFDSSELIQRLFEKMPDEKAILIVKELVKRYDLD